MAKDVIIALDFENKEKTLAFLDQFTGRKLFVKIGMSCSMPKARTLCAKSRRADTRFSLT